MSALLLNWVEQDAIFGDTSGAPSQSQVRSSAVAVGCCLGFGRLECGRCQCSPLGVWVTWRAFALGGV